jgi:uncharacterized protein YijF (DUF1287 family)
LKAGRLQSSAKTIADQTAHTHKSDHETQFQDDPRRQYLMFPESNQDIHRRLPQFLGSLARQRRSQSPIDFIKRPREYLPRNRLS